MNEVALKEFLDYKAHYYEQASFIESDPISLVHQFHKKQDIEIVGFLIATISWGQRKSIIQSGKKLLKILGSEPLQYVSNYNDGDCGSFVHRTFNQIDLNGFLMALKAIYQHGDLELAFMTSMQNPTLYHHISAFRERFIPYLEKRSLKHVANPNKGSSAKRLIMFLRWMVRSNKNGVDFGIWDSIPQGRLMIPLDVHTGNIARKLGLLHRKQNDWKANEELVFKLRKMDPTDPAKYDFALFGLGAIEKF